MKKTITIVLLSIVCIFSSCNKDDELLNPIAIDGNSALSVGDSVNLLPTGETVHIAFTADSKWTLNGLKDVDWLTASVTSGKQGTTLVEIKASINYSGYSRSAKLQFVGDKIKKEFTVIQDIPVLNISSDSLFFDWNRCEESNASPVQLTIESNIHWKLSVDREASAHDITYFSQLDTIALGDTVLSILPQKYNLSKAEENTYLIIQPIAYDDKKNAIVVTSKIPSYRIKLHQNNLRFLLNDSLEIDTVVVGPLNDNDSLFVTVDAERLWNVEYPDWIKISIPEGIDTIRPTRLYIKADTVRQERVNQVGKVSITLKNFDVRREFWVCQKGYRFEIDNTSFGLENGDTTVHSAVLKSSGPWVVRNIPSWLTVHPSSGNGDAIISITASHNLEQNDVRSELQICSTLNPLLEKVNVTQKKFEFSISSSSLSLLADIPTLNTNKYSISLKTSGQWEVKNIPDWLYVNLSSGDKGTHTLLIGANSENKDLSSDRTANLVINSIPHSNAHKDLTILIPIKQRKFTFSLSKTDLGTIPAYKKQFGSYSVLVKCSSNWDVVSIPSWLSVTPSEGTGINDETLVFTPTKPNVSSTARDSIITIRSKLNEETKTITVRQDGFVFNLYSIPDDSIAEIGAPQLTLPLSCTAEAGWSISTPSWITTTSNSGEGNATIRLSVTNNLSFEPRQGTVSVNSSVPGVSPLQFSINQKAFKFDSTPVEQSYDAVQDASLDIDVLCSSPWTASADNGIRLNKTSGQGRTDGLTESITAILDSNLTHSYKTYQIRVTSSAIQSLQKVITLHRSAFEFTPANDSIINLLSYETTSRTVDVTCSSAWMVSSNQPWATISSPTGGSGHGTGAIHINIGENPTYEQRTAVITITTKTSSPETRTITIHQPAAPTPPGEE